MGFWASDIYVNSCREVPWQVNFFRRRHLQYRTYIHLLLPQVLLDRKTKGVGSTSSLKQGYDVAWWKNRICLMTRQMCQIAFAVEHCFVLTGKPVSQRLLHCNKTLGRIPPSWPDDARLKRTDGKMIALYKPGIWYLSAWVLPFRNPGDFPCKKKKEYAQGGSNYVLRSTDPVLYH